MFHLVDVTPPPSIRGACEAKRDYISYAHSARRFLVWTVEEEKEEEVRRRRPTNEWVLISGQKCLPSNEPISVIFSSFLICWLFFFCQNLQVRRKYCTYAQGLTCKLLFVVNDVDTKTVLLSLSQSYSEFAQICSPSALRTPLSNKRFSSA